MSAGQVTLTDEEYALLSSFLVKRYGLSFPESKRAILESRLRSRLEAHGLQRFMDYYLLLQVSVNGARNEELEHLVGSITNNETYFFRETHQFEALFGEALDGLKSSSPYRRGLRFLCAGCSSGEEPYTLNIYVRQNLYRLGGAPVSIDAFDLDESKVKVAVAAEYGRRSCRAMAADQIERYFNSIGDDRLALKPLFRSGVRFTVGNILDRSHISVPSVYDVIFCRNVLIYFSEEALHQAVENFAYWLRPGGLLFLGHSESIIGRSCRFKAIRLMNTIAYQLVE